MDQPAFTNIEYECDHEHRRIRVRCGPATTSADFMRVIDRQVADGGWTYGLLYDLTARSPGAKEGAMRVARYLGMYVRALGARGPVAIVTRDVSATRTALAYGQSLGFRAEAFTDATTAERWLDGTAGQDGSG